MDGWKTDRTTGRRYRMVGSIKEYERELVTTAGTFTEGELRSGTPVVKVLPEKEPQAKMPLCPFGTSRFNDTHCSGEACALFAGDGCTLAQIGSEPEHDTLGLRCPFAGAACNCRSECALYRDGCVLTGLRKENGNNE